MAMVASERLQYSVGVGYYAGGFDPSNSSIPNPGSSFSEVVSIMENLGFASISISPTADDIEAVLTDYGPFILSHNCVGFPYGPGWTPPTRGRHAVVITAIDTGAGMCWMNNPWGNKDREITVSAVRQALTSIQTGGKRPVAYYNG
jgi:hypothetical protein